MSKLLDQFYWVLLLLSIAGMSILSGRFDSIVWQHAAAAFYAYSAIYLMHLATGRLSYNRGALIAARPVLILLSLIPAWLALQLVLPGSPERLFSWYSDLARPEWFAAELKISVHEEKTRWLLATSIFIFVWFLLCVCQIRSRQRLQQILCLLLVIALVHSLVGVFALEAKIFLVDPGQLDGHFDVARGWFVNRNHYAALLLLAGSGGIALILSRLFEPRSFGRVKLAGYLLLGMLCMLLVALALIYSQSRAGLLTPLLAAAIILAGFWSRGRQLPHGPSMVLLALIMVVVLLVLIGEPALQRLRALSLGERVLQWQISLEAISNAPWFGYGGGSYATVFQIYRDHAELRQVVYNQSHNEYLHIWLEQGIIGLILFLGVIIAAFRFSIKTVNQSSDTLLRATLLAAMFCLLAALLQAGVDFNLQIVNLRCFFFLWVALAFAAPFVQHQSVRQAM